MAKDDLQCETSNRFRQLLAYNMIKAFEEKLRVDLDAG